MSRFKRSINNTLSIGMINFNNIYHPHSNLNLFKYVRAWTDKKSARDITILPKKN